MIWNPWHGCNKISEGCRNCYVYRMDAKYEKDSSSVKRNKCFYDLIKRKRDGSYKIEKGETIKMYSNNPVKIELMIRN